MTTKDIGRVIDACLSNVQTTERDTDALMDYVRMEHPVRRRLAIRPRLAIAVLILLLLTLLFSILAISDYDDSELVIYTTWLDETLDIRFQLDSEPGYLPPIRRKAFTEAEKQVWSEEVISALESGGYYPPLPTWMPEGFTQYGVGFLDCSPKMGLAALWDFVDRDYETDGKGIIKLQIEIHPEDMDIGDVLFSIQRDKNVAEALDIGGIRFYHVTNLGHDVYVWLYGNAVYTLSGDVGPVLLWETVRSISFEQVGDMKIRYESNTEGPVPTQTPVVPTKAPTQTAVPSAKPVLTDAPERDRLTDGERAAIGEAAADEMEAEGFCPPVPEYLPEGFAVDSVNVTRRADSMGYLYMRCTDGADGRLIISVEELPGPSGTSTISIMCDTAEPVCMEIGGRKYWYTTNCGKPGFVWVYGDMIYHLSGSVGEDELRRIIWSIGFEAEVASEAVFVPGVGLSVRGGRCIVEFDAEDSVKGNAGILNEAARQDAQDTGAALDDLRSPSVLQMLNEKDSAKSKEGYAFTPELRAIWGDFDEIIIDYCGIVPALPKYMPEGVWRAGKGGTIEDAATAYARYTNAAGNNLEMLATVYGVNYVRLSPISLPGEGYEAEIGGRTFRFSTDNGVNYMTWCDRYGSYIVSCDAGMLYLKDIAASISPEGGQARYDNAPENSWYKSPGHYFRKLNIWPALPEYMPEGYEFNENTGNNYGTKHWAKNYEDESGRRFTISVMTFPEDNASPMTPTLSDDYTDMEINGVVFRFASDGEANSVAWCDEIGSYSISGDLTLDELEAMARSVDFSKGKKVPRIITRSEYSRKTMELWGDVMLYSLELKGIHISMPEWMPGRLDAFAEQGSQNDSTGKFWHFTNYSDERGRSYQFRVERVPEDAQGSTISLVGGQQAEIFMHNGTPYYLVSEEERFTAHWFEDDMYIKISLQTGVEDLKTMIRSIRKYGT